MVYLGELLDHICLAKGGEHDSVKQTKLLCLIQVTNIPVMCLIMFGT